MRSPRLEALDRGIRDVLVPELKARGFRYDGATRTFRRGVGECTQIINFQAGVRGMAGKFTINLGVFHPVFHESSNPEPRDGRPLEYHCLVEARARLGHLMETPITRFFRPRIRDTGTFWKWWLVTPSDRWWAFGPDPEPVSRRLGDIKPLLIDLAIPWLDSRSDAEMLKAAFEKRQARVKSIAQHGSI